MYIDLQKIVYFCYVWFLIWFGVFLIRYKFEVWEFGLVFFYFYRDFKNFECLLIIVCVCEIDCLIGEKKIVVYDFDVFIEVLFNEVVDFYSCIWIGNFVELSYVVGGLWYKVWYYGGSFNFGMKLNDEDIVEFYFRVLCLFLI